MQGIDENPKEQDAQKLGTNELKTTTEGTETDEKYIHSIGITDSTNSNSTSDAAASGSEHPASGQDSVGSSSGEHSDRVLPLLGASGEPDISAFERPDKPGKSTISSGGTKFVPIQSAVNTREQFSGKQPVLPGGKRISNIHSDNGKPTNFGIGDKSQSDMRIVGKAPSRPDEPKSKLIYLILGAAIILIGLFYTFKNKAAMSGRL